MDGIVFLRQGDELAWRYGVSHAFEFVLVGPDGVILSRDHDSNIGELARRARERLALSLASVEQ
jgi:hypothetical protein